MRLLFLSFYCLCFPDNLFSQLEITELAFALYCISSNFVIYVMKTFVLEG